MANRKASADKRTSATSSSARQSVRGTWMLESGRHRPSHIPRQPFSEGPQRIALCFEPDRPSQKLSPTRRLALLGLPQLIFGGQSHWLFNDSYQAMKERAGESSILVPKHSRSRVLLGIRMAYECFSHIQTHLAVKCPRWLIQKAGRK